MSHSNDSLTTAAIEAVDYRSLIRLSMGSRKGRRPFTLDELARKAGFGSKGFISDLLSGKKRMSARAFPRILQALNLPKRVETIFTLLVYLQEEDLRLPGDTEDNLKKRLEKSQKSLRNQILRTDRSKENIAIQFVHRHVVYRVFASLGSIENGASLSQITRRSKLTENAVSNALEALNQLGLIRIAGNRYYAETSTIEVLGLREDSALKSVLTSAAESLIHAVSTLERRPNDCFFYASFAIDAEAEIVLKQKIQELIVDFINSYQNEDGAVVKSLLLGLF